MGHESDPIPNIPLGKYRNSKKGKLYEVTGFRRHSETLEWMVDYSALYENPLGKDWTRPVSIWLQEVEVEGQVVPRFVKIEE